MYFFSSFSILSFMRTACGVDGISGNVQRGKGLEIASCSGTKPGTCLVMYASKQYNVDIVHGFKRRAVGVFQITTTVLTRQGKLPLFQSQGLPIKQLYSDPQEH